jgi:hypothetical protein
MQSTVFTYLAKNYYLNTSTSVKVLLFVKLDDDKVIVKASRPGNGMGIDVVMSYDQLMKHKYLKAYYELSLKAIGKPNLDPEYGVLGAKEVDAIDAIYIVEDVLTKEKVAKKGESYHTISNYLNAKDEEEDDDEEGDCEDDEEGEEGEEGEDDDYTADETVATDAELAEFNAAYDAKFDETNFEERVAIYKALVDNM